jgi:predicted SAM-dependent methyltransferase
MRLHIGGTVRSEGWTVLNIKPGPATDIVGDCANLSAFPNGSIAQIYASHVYEHLSMSRVGEAFAEAFRVLEPGGLFQVAVPDVERLAVAILDPKLSIYGVWEAMRILYGGDLDEHDRHSCGFTEDLLGGALVACGFDHVRRVESFGLFQDASLASFVGGPISLNMEAWKP